MTEEAVGLADHPRGGRGGGDLRRRLGGRTAAWIAFATVHALLAALNLVGPANPMWDVTAVYRLWAENADSGWVRMGIDAPWVYPILAFAPMAAALAFGSALYGATWLGIVTVLDAIAFAVLLGRGVVSRRRRAAAWWWVGFLALLGPIALGRIDAVTVPLAILGLLWAAGRPRVAATLLTLAAWIKVWPAALVLALVVALRRRAEVVIVGGALTAGILGVSLIAGSGANALGFVAAQAGRGLQLESPLAVPWLWWMVAGSREATIVFDEDLITFQVDGPGVDAVAALATPLMAVAAAVVLALGIRAVRRGAHLVALLAPLATAFTTVLLVANKVGSPQFVTWLAAPAVLGLALGGRRHLAPAVVSAAIALLTLLIFPYGYSWLIVAHPALVLLLSLKVLLLLVLLGWAVHAVWQAGSVRRTPMMDAAA